jgi:hypothetical protein
MKLAHLILAHTAPKQLERLINNLSHPDADIYIHLDKKTDILPFTHLANRTNVFFIKNRVKVYWASSSIVTATLNGFKEIIESGKNYKYLNLLSGQDYPLKSPADIHKYFADNPGRAFMNYLHFEPDWLEAVSRIKEYHFINLRMPGKYTLQRAVNKILPERKMPNGLVPVGRSQWFTIPMECVRYIVDYWETNPKLRRFINLTWGADEFLFQTILYNSPFKNKMINNDCRYIDWSDGGVSPKTLTMADADALVTCGKLFARKFDINKDEAVLDFIDQHITSQKQAL